MGNVFNILQSIWNCISSFEIYGIKFVPFTFAVCGIIVFIRILMHFLNMGGD